MQCRILPMQRWIRWTWLEREWIASSEVTMVKGDRISARMKMRKAIVFARYVPLEPLNALCEMLTAILNK